MLREGNRPVGAWLKAHGLPSNPEADPLQPVSNYHALAFITYAANQEGPDLGCRVVMPDSFMFLGAVGDAIRRSSSPRMAFARAGAATQFHNSHASYGFTGAPVGNAVQHHALLRLAQLAAHQLQQHAAALFLSVCRLTGVPEVADICFSLEPHPESGLDHLRPHLGQHLEATRTRGLTIHIPDEVLDAPIRWPDHWPAVSERPPEIGRVGCTSLSQSARILIAGWLREGSATLEQLASSAGRSERSVQRILAAEGTNFRQIHDEMRRQEAIVRLERTSASVGDIANDLGYSYQSSFTRAVRRWLEDSPTKVRQR